MRAKKRGSKQAPDRPTTIFSDDKLGDISSDDEHIHRKDGRACLASWPLYAPPLRPLQPAEPLTIRPRPSRGSSLACTAYTVIINFACDERRCR